MAEFSEAYNFMICHEVRHYHQPNQVWYTNTPGDKGGPTAWGVTEATARTYGYADSMETMLEMDAIGIYKRAFWKFDGISSQQIASKLFDACVNLGVKRAVRLMQQSLGFDEAQQDGIYGPQTEGAINAAQPAALLEAFVQQLLNRYHNIVLHDPSQEKFLKGWTNRALELPPEA